MKEFLFGIKAILPILTGVIPFGVVMGAIFAKAKLDFISAMAMNILVFAGASQMAAIELMTNHTTSFVVIITGITINLRFLLYSAALSPILNHSNFLTKALGAYCITDQTYTATIANQDQLLSLDKKIKFYFGASLGMIISWQTAVALGFSFGNFAPATLSLDYAVPLSFIALALPTLKNKNYVLVAIFSSLCSLLFSAAPYNLGLIFTTLLSIILILLIKKIKRGNHD